MSDCWREASLAGIPATPPRPPRPPAPPHRRAWPQRVGGGGGGAARPRRRADRRRLQRFGCAQWRAGARAVGVEWRMCVATVGASDAAARARRFRGAVAAAAAESDAAAAVRTEASGGAAARVLGAWHEVAMLLASLGARSAAVSRLVGRRMAVGRGRDGRSDARRTRRCVAPSSTPKPFGITTSPSALTGARRSCSVRWWTHGTRLQ